MAAWSWYSPIAPFTRCALDQGNPFGDERLIPQCSILLRQRDQLPRGVGSRGAPGIDEEHEREQPGDLGVAGKHPLQHPGQPDRLLGQLGALQLATVLLAYPSLKIRYSTCRTVRTLAVCSSRVGIRNCTPEVLIRCFALEIRCAMVASPTRNAFAISAVVSPPTARNVSAIAEAGVSDGWQHMNNTINVSS
jgi:hypothetical protein